MRPTPTTPGSLSDRNEKGAQQEDNKSSNEKDSRLKGEPGEIKKSKNKETHIGPNGRADRERHWSDHGNPKKHTIPHDHNISWNSDGDPNFGPPQNYWDGNIPIFP